MYDAARVIGDYFEEKVMTLFELEKLDRVGLGIVPDLVSRDGSFYVEVKASAYNNGGVIKRKQLYGFVEAISARRFYAFCYHQIRAGSIQRDYPTEELLIDALRLRSLFLFPYSITRAHLETTKKRRHPRGDDFVQLIESQARGVFETDKVLWSRLGLCPEDYQMTRPHDRVHIVTREGHLEREILDSFHPETLT